MYETFYQWNKEIVVRLVMVVFFAFSVLVVLMKSTEDEGISTMPTVKFEIFPWKEQIKKKTLRYLPSYLPEMTRKQNVFLRQRVTVVIWKMVEKNLKFDQKHFR